MNIKTFLYVDAVVAVIVDTVGAIITKNKTAARVATLLALSTGVRHSLEQ